VEIQGGNAMSDSEYRSAKTITLPEEIYTDREVIRLLREEDVVVYFDCPGFDAYVKAPEVMESTDEVIEEFTVWYNDDYSEEDWEQTSINPLTLKRELREREFSIVNESPGRRVWTDE
jgi:hypothetical protein